MSYLSVLFFANIFSWPSFKNTFSSAVQKLVRTCKRKIKKVSSEGRHPPLAYYHLPFKPMAPPRSSLRASHCCARSMPPGRATLKNYQVTLSRQDDQHDIDSLCKIFQENEEKKKERERNRERERERKHLCKPNGEANRWRLRQSAQFRSCVRY